MSTPPTQQQFEHDSALRAPLSKLESDAVTPAAHDAAILNSARAASQSIHARTTVRSRWHMPASMAASFIVGVMLTALLATQVSQQAQEVAVSEALTMPVGNLVRGVAAPRTVPVEEAPAEQWYRYIQELIYSGDVQLAQRHLRRFVELHPEYEHRP